MAVSADAAAVTSRYRARLAAIRDGVTQLVTARWSGTVDLDRVAASFDGWAEQARLIVTAGQIQVARLAAAYLAAYLAAAGGRAVTDPPDPTSYAGTDMDGRPLTRSLDTARIATLYLLGRGQPRPRALAYGLDSALRISRSAVMTAARSAQADLMDAEPAVAGWVRVTSSSPCGACLALAGIRQTARDTFDAHDRCGCTAEPAIAGVAERLRRPSGAELLDRMDPRTRARYPQVDADHLDQLIARRNGRIYQASITA